MANRIEVKNAQEAWDMANKIFPGDYDKDEESSRNAGYPIYRNSHEFYNYICDLGDRLEVNLKADNKTINIWIADDEQGQDVEIAVKVMSGEARAYKTYADFRKDFRFFLSSGNRYVDNEEHFEKIIKSLREINEDGIKMESHRSGMTIVFTYKKWQG